MIKFKVTYFNGKLSEGRLFFKETISYLKQCLDYAVDNKTMIKEFNLTYIHD